MRTPPRPSRTWVRDLGSRLRHLFWLKLLGTTAFTWLFFLGYFHLLRFPARAVHEMPLTALDRWIPFEPTALVAYLSLWVYVGIAPGLQRDLRALLGHGAWAAALCGTGLALFWLWPTRVPALSLPAVDFPGFALMHGVDAAGNACPSMHVAIAVFSACRVERLCRDIGTPAWPRAANLAWCLLIAWSTVAVRQHVVLDAVAGALLGGGFAAVSLRVPAALWPQVAADMIPRPSKALRPAPAGGAGAESHPGVAP